MSTRGIIAKSTGDGWEGVYVHSDNYPTWRGKHDLWPSVAKWVQQQATRLQQERAIEMWCEQRIDKHHGGWSQLGTSCFCHDEKGRKRRGEPDMFYRFGEPLPFDVDWVWVLDQRRLSITVYHLLNPGAVSIEPPVYTWREAFDIGRESIEYNLGLYFVTEFDMLGDEPNWQDMQHIRCILSDASIYSSCSDEQHERSMRLYRRAPEGVAL